MPIIVNLDVMLARRKMRSKELAERIGITEQNVSLLKSGKVKGVRFDTLEKHLPRARLSARRHSGIPDGGEERGVTRTMALRIAVGGFMHESTTFVDQPTTWDDFARTGAWPGACEGEAMLATHGRD